jgi:hypothetical protein
MLCDVKVKATENTDTINALELWGKGGRKRRREKCPGEFVNKQTLHGEAGKTGGRGCGERKIYMAVRI